MKYNITGPGRQLGATTDIGTDLNGQDATGTMNLSSMSGNIAISNALNISSKGTLNLNQNQQSDTAGGIVEYNQAVFKITSSGKINRTVADAGGKVLKLGVPITNEAGAIVDIGSALDIETPGQNPCIASSGFITLEAAASLTGPNGYYINSAGTLNSKGAGNLTTDTIGPLFVATGGGVNLGDANVYVHLAVKGNYTMNGGALSLHVAASNTNNTYSAVVADGNIVIDPLPGESAGLSVTTDSGTAQSGSYDILQGAGPANGPDFASFAWGGNTPPGGYRHKFANGKYTLSFG